MVRLPNNRQRITIVGRTGSGKTVAAVWHLSLRDIDKRPWVIIDYKCDELINSIEKAQHVDVGFVPGKKDTGIFIAHPVPEQDDDKVNEWLWKLWARENVGVYADEGYMVAGCPAYNTLLTQGRSKNIPMITLSQRPVWISRFCFSEADFFQVFDLIDRRDQKTVESFIPVSLEHSLPDFHSYYFDVGKKKLTVFKPVPSGESILKTIDSKLTKSRRKV